jgi:hypothetical protein
MSESFDEKDMPEIFIKATVALRKAVKAGGRPTFGAMNRLWRFIPTDRRFP